MCLSMLYVLYVKAHVWMRGHRCACELTCVGVIICECEFLYACGHMCLCVYYVWRLSTLYKDQDFSLSQEFTFWLDFISLLGKSLSSSQVLGQVGHQPHPAFKWILVIWTLVLMLAGPTLFLLSHPPVPVLGSWWWAIATSNQSPVWLLS